MGSSMMNKTQHFVPNRTLNHIVFLNIKCPLYHIWNSLHILRQCFSCMPLPYVYCFDLVHVSLASWLNYIIHGGKKRNVLHEKCRLENPKKMGWKKKTKNNWWRFKLEWNIDKIARGNLIAQFQCRYEKTLFHECVEVNVHDIQQGGRVN